MSPTNVSTCKQLSESVNIHIHSFPPHNHFTNTGLVLYSLLKKNFKKCKEVEVENI